MPRPQGARRQRHATQTLSRRPRHRTDRCAHRRRLRLRPRSQCPRRLQLADPELRRRDGLHSRRRDLHLRFQPRRVHRAIARRLHQHLRPAAPRCAAHGQRALANLLPDRAGARAPYWSAHRPLPGPAARVPANHRSRLGSVAGSPEGGRGATRTGLCAGSTSRHADPDRGTARLLVTAREDHLPRRVRHGGRGRMGCAGDTWDTQPSRAASQHAADDADPAVPARAGHRRAPQQLQAHPVCGVHQR